MIMGKSSYRKRSLIHLVRVDSDAFWCSMSYFLYLVEMELSDGKDQNISI